MFARVYLLFQATTHDFLPDYLNAFFEQALELILITQS